MAGASKLFFVRDVPLVFSTLRAEIAFKDLPDAVDAAACCFGE
jgi:hypothetical protein